MLLVIVRMSDVGLVPTTAESSTACAVTWRHMTSVEDQSTDLRGSTGRRRSLQVRCCRCGSVWRAWRASSAVHCRRCTAPGRQTAPWTWAASLCTPCLYRTVHNV